jgi:hypothetical protein
VTQVSRGGCPVMVQTRGRRWRLRGQRGSVNQRGVHGSGGVAGGRREAAGDGELFVEEEPARVTACAVALADDLPRGRRHSRRWWTDSRSAATGDVDSMVWCGAASRTGA